MVIDIYILLIFINLSVLISMTWSLKGINTNMEKIVQELDAMRRETGYMKDTLYIIKAIIKSKFGEE